MERSSWWKVAVVLGLLGVWGLASWQQQRANAPRRNADAPAAQTSPTPSSSPSGPTTPTQKTPTQTTKTSTKPVKETTMNGMKIEDLEVGAGAEAKSGQSVTVHYRGTLTSGKQFDASYDRGQPFTFTLGSGQVIKGWDLGVAGMKVGGKRRLTIPPDLGYRDRDMGVIPPNSTLVFDVELLNVG